MEILLDGITNETIGIKLASLPIIPSSEQRVERMTIDGRNGDLTKLVGYSDIDLPVEFNHVGEARPKLRDIKKWLLNKKKLVFSDDPNYFYKIKSFRVSEATNNLENYIAFTVDFNCEPFQYKKTELVTLNVAGSLNNEGSYYSQPLLKVFGVGNGTVTVNGSTFNLNGLVDHISVDCELEEAHRFGISRNNKMVGNFPKFKVGLNTISWNTAVTKIEIEPRWRYV